MRAASALGETAVLLPQDESLTRITPKNHVFNGKKLGHTVFFNSLFILDWSIADL